MKSFAKLLEGYEFHGAGEFISSLAPSLKYNLIIQAVGVSAMVSAAETVFGLNWAAFLALSVVMLWELVSGLWAARVKKEELSSRKFSRFLFKNASYLIVIGVPWLFSESFNAKGDSIVSGLFSWLHMFFVVSIVLENLISILENMAVITGKDKAHWISKLTNKVDEIL